MLVSSAATENKISVIYFPKKSSRSIEAIIKLIFMPNKIISKANRINNKLGLKIIIKKAKKMKSVDKDKIVVIIILQQYLNSVRS